MVDVDEDADADADAAAAAGDTGGSVVAVLLDLLVAVLADAMFATDTGVAVDVEAVEAEDASWPSEIAVVDAEIVVEVASCVKLLTSILFALDDCFMFVRCLFCC